MSKGHEILWADEGCIGYRCYDDKPGLLASTIVGVDERDIVVACPVCKVHLKASWSVRLDPTDEPETVL